MKQFPLYDIVVITTTERFHMSRTEAAKEYYKAQDVVYGRTDVYFHILGVLLDLSERQDADEELVGNLRGQWSDTKTPPMTDAEKADILYRDFGIPQGLTSKYLDGTESPELREALRDDSE